MVTTPELLGTRRASQNASAVRWLDSPFPFKGGLWYIGHRYHLLSRSHPHYRTVVALRGIHLIQTGEGPPRKRELHSDRRRTRLETKRCVRTPCFSVRRPIQGSRRHPAAEFCHRFPDVLERVRTEAKAVCGREMPEDICLLILCALPRWRSGDLSEVSARRNKTRRSPMSAFQTRL